MMIRAYEVRVEEPAKSSLQALIQEDSESAAGIMRALEVLKSDPYVCITGVRYTRSAAVAILRREGFKIRYLKGWDFSDYRVFYHIDKVRGKVIVKEIISRELDTCLPNAPHIERLRANFAKHHFFRGGVRR